MVIPNGAEHLRLLAMCNQQNLEAFASELKNAAQNLRVIGSSLSTLYQAATCQRGCNGGPHILEALAGRTYNLGCAAYVLNSYAFYDESLNLIRGIGEISNLISLSVVDKDALRRWLAADPPTRIRDFSPARIRRLLETQNAPMYADKQWYSSLCEYTHINPDTKPNLHNDQGKAYAGGVFQQTGLARCLDELATVLCMVAMLVSKYFRFEDQFEELCDAVGSATESGKPAS